jgi:hypothetical protein
LQISGADWAGVRRYSISTKVLYKFVNRYGAGATHNP